MRRLTIDLYAQELHRCYGFTNIRASHRACYELDASAPLREPIGPQYAGFVERLMYHSLDVGLRAGRVSTVVNGKVVTEAEAVRLVSFARGQRWLPSLVKS